MCASKNGHVEIAELLLEQEGININAKDHILYLFFVVCLNNTIFGNNIWKQFELFETALILATRNGKIDIVKLLLKHNGIDINVKGFYILYLNFIMIIYKFIVVFGNYLNYLRQHL